MCYMVYLASSKPINIDEWQYEEMKVQPFAGPIKDLAPYFANENLYVLSSKAGCGCEFRIAMSRAAGFTEPQAWFPESKDSISGTLLIYNLLQSILREGGEAELLSVWKEHLGKPVKSEEIDLNSIDERSFRMFENQKLIIHSAGAFG